MAPKVIKKELIEYPKKNLLTEIFETMIIHIGF